MGDQVAGIRDQDSNRRGSADPVRAKREDSRGSPLLTAGLTEAECVNTGRLALSQFPPRDGVPRFQVAEGVASSPLLPAARAAGSRAHPVPSRQVAPLVRRHPPACARSSAATCPPGGEQSRAYGGWDPEALREPCLLLSDLGCHVFPLVWHVGQSRPRPVPVSPRPLPAYLETRALGAVRARAGAPRLLSIGRGPRTRRKEPGSAGHPLRPVLRSDVHVGKRSRASPWASEPFARSSRHRPAGGPRRP
jgi:hypothetical protein